VKALLSLYSQQTNLPVPAHKGLDLRKQLNAIPVLSLPRSQRLPSPTRLESLRLEALAEPCDRLADALAHVLFAEPTKDLMKDFLAQLQAHLTRESLNRVDVSIEPKPGVVEDWALPRWSGHLLRKTAQLLGTPIYLLSQSACYRIGTSRDEPSLILNLGIETSEDGLLVACQPLRAAPNDSTPSVRSAPLDLSQPVAKRSKT
jgi:hypothetical protein